MKLRIFALLIIIGGASLILLHRAEVPSLRAQLRSFALGTADTSPVDSKKSNGVERATNPSPGFLTLKDTNGRTLECRIFAKRSPFIGIERQPDSKKFLLQLKTLAGESRARVEAMPDFNIHDLDADILTLAKSSVQTEVLSSRELSTFRCKYNGEIMKSSVGLSTDAYRADLTQMGFSYREVWLNLSKTPDNKFLLIPEGITQLPCLRINKTIIYGRDPEKIRRTIIDEYVITAALTQS